MCRLVKIAVIAVAVTLTGCGQVVPECSDKEAKELLIEIANGLLKEHNATVKKVRYIRTVRKDDSGSVKCTAEILDSDGDELQAVYEMHEGEGAEKGSFIMELEFE